MNRPQNNRFRGARRPTNLSRIVVPARHWPKIGDHFGWTTRELEVGQLLFANVKEPAIARRLKISYGTVKKIVEHIYEKMRVHSHGEFLLGIVENYLQGVKEDRTDTPPHN